MELGRTVQAQAELVLPVRASIEKAVAEAGKGSVLVGTPQVRRGAWRWSTQVWHVTAEVLSLIHIFPAPLPRSA